MSRLTPLVLLRHTVFIRYVCFTFNALRDFRLEFNVTLSAHPMMPSWFSNLRLIVCKRLSTTCISVLRSGFSPNATACFGAKCKLDMMLSNLSSVPVHRCSSGQLQAPSRT